jgi:hypothetical protein
MLSSPRSPRLSLTSTMSAFHPLQTLASSEIRPAKPCEQANEASDKSKHARSQC